MAVSIILVNIYLVDAINICFNIVHVHSLKNAYIIMTFLDMQKFPLRMKDNDLLVTELYKDPTLDHITAISVYLTPKTTSKYSRMHA